VNPDQVAADLDAANAVLDDLRNLLLDVEARGELVLDDLRNLLLDVEARGELRVPVAAIRDLLGDDE